MSRTNLFHNDEQIASRVCPSISVPAFTVSWFALLNMGIEQSFFHFIYYHLMLDPNLFFDFEGNLQLIEVHAYAPIPAILGCSKEQSRQKLGAAVYRFGWTQEAENRTLRAEIPQGPLFREGQTKADVQRSLS